MAKTINLTDDWYSSNYPDKYTITTKGDCQVQLGGMETGSKYTGGTGKDTVTIEDTAAPGWGMSGTTFTDAGGDNTVVVSGQWAQDGNSGAMSNSTVTLGGGNDNLAITGVVKSSTIKTGAGNDTVTFNHNGGGGLWDNSSLDTGAGNDTVYLNAGLDGAIKLGDGNDNLHVIATSSPSTDGTRKATLDGGAGTDTLHLHYAAHGEITSGALNMVDVFPNISSAIKGVEIIQVGETVTSLTLNNEDVRHFDTASMTALTGTLKGQKILRVTGEENSVDLSLSHWYMARSNIVEGGVTYDLWKSYDGDDVQVLIRHGAVADAANLPGYDATAYGNIAAAGNDTLTLDSAALASAVRVNLGEGNNTFTANGDIGEKSIVSTGAGADKITVTGSVGDNTVIEAGAGNDTITVGSVGDASIRGGAGNDTITIAQTANIAGTVEAGDGNDKVYLNGQVVTGGEISTGAGDDIVYIPAQPGTDPAVAAGGQLDGGAGTDTLNLAGKSGNFNLADIATGTGTVKGFEILDMTGGNANTLHINAAHLATFNCQMDTSTANALKIDNVYNGADKKTLLNALKEETNLVRVHGDTKDTVLFDSSEGWTLQGAVKCGGVAYNAYKSATGEYVLVKNSVKVDTFEGNNNSNDVLTLENGAEYITSNPVGEGNDVATIITKGDSTVTLGGGMDSATYTGGTGKDTVTIGNAAAPGWGMSGSTFTDAGGDNTVVVSGQWAHSGSSGAMYDSTVTLGGGNDNLTITGLVKSSTIITGAGNDTVTFNHNGGGGLWDNSSLDTGAGDDTVYLYAGLDNSAINLGEGNDNLHSIAYSSNIDGSGNATLDGGAGTDTLHLYNAMQGVLTLGVINMANVLPNIDSAIQGVEIISIADENALGITLTAADVARFTNTSDGQPLRIQGNAGDTVTLDGDGWTQGASSTINGVNYTLWQNGNASVLVQDGLVLTHSLTPVDYSGQTLDNSSEEEGEILAVLAGTTNFNATLSDHDDTVLLFGATGLDDILDDSTINLGIGNDVIDAQGQVGLTNVNITGGAGDDAIYVGNGQTGISFGSVDIAANGGALDEDVLSVNGGVVSATITKGTHDHVIIHGDFSGSTLTESDEEGEAFFTEITGNMNNGFTPTTVTLFGGLRIDGDLTDGSITMKSGDYEHDNEVWLGGMSGGTIDATENTAGTAQLHLLLDGKTGDDFNPFNDDGDVFDGGGDAFAGLFDQGTAMASGIDTLYLDMGGTTSDTLDLSGDREGSLESLFKVGSSDGQIAGEADIRIVGDSGDTVKLDADYTKGGASTLDGITYDTWFNEDYTVYIQQQLMVVTG
ncbi:MAG: hypothetical protein LBO64_05650 [Desulfovibrio sp.]|jgi:hypothetical protein|nr:hypothetical protein [Desulfovibrio sp.]